MRVEVACSRCANKFSVPANLAGGTYTCAACKKAEEQATGTVRAAGLCLVQLRRLGGFSREGRPGGLGRAKRRPRPGCAVSTGTRAGAGAPRDCSASAPSATRAASWAWSSCFHRSDSFSARSPTGGFRFWRTCGCAAAYSRSASRPGAGRTSGGRYRQSDTCSTRLLALAVVARALWLRALLPRWGGNGRLAWPGRSVLPATAATHGGNQGRSCPAERESGAFKSCPSSRNTCCR
jgi:hypothetical protein